MSQHVHRSPPMAHTIWRSVRLIALLFGLWLTMVGCTQDNGSGGVDANLQQDTGGQISDTVAQGDTVATDAAKVDTGAADIGVLDTGAADTGAAQLRWFTTCGDPACHGYKTKPNVPLCTSEQVGAACSAAAATCDPKSSCNALLVCAKTDPKLNPGGCPISSRRFKAAIRYLDASAEAGLRDDLLQLPLATWQYRDSPRKRRNLGYILQDAPQLPSSDLGRERVDLYALSTMTVAAIKAQQREMQVLRAQIAALQARCAKPVASPALK